MLFLLLLAFLLLIARWQTVKDKYGYSSTLLTMLGDKPLMNCNSEFVIFIQPNSHLELFKLPNILLYLEILLAKRGEIEAELLLVSTM